MRIKTIEELEDFEYAEFENSCICFLSHDGIPNEVMTIEMIQYCGNECHIREVLTEHKYRIDVFNEGEWKKSHWVWTTDMLTEEPIETKEYNIDCDILI